jgi:hypothetical protein
MDQLEQALDRLGDLLAPFDAGPHGVALCPPMPGGDDAFKSDMIQRAHLVLSQGRSLLLGTSAKASDRAGIEFTNLTDLLANDIAFTELAARLREGDGAAGFIEIRDAIHAVAVAATLAAG